MGLVRGSALVLPEARKVSSRLGLARWTPVEYKTPASRLGRSPGIGLCITNVICVFLEAIKDLWKRLPSKLPIPPWSESL